MKQVIRNLFIGSLVYFSSNYSMDDYRNRCDLIKNLTQPIEFLENRVTKFLKSQGSADGEYANKLLLEASAHKNGTGMVAKLLEYRVDPNKIPENLDFASLHMACEYDNKSAVKLLLNSKADVNVKSQGLTGDVTPLHSTALRGSLDIVAILLEKAPDLDAQDYPLSDTPLHYVILTSYLPDDLVKKIDFIKRLICAGASPYLRKKCCNHETGAYEIGENVYELIEKKMSAAACVQIKKYRSELRLHVCWVLTQRLKPLLSKNNLQSKDDRQLVDILQLIVNSLYPNNPEKKS